MIAITAGYLLICLSRVLTNLTTVKLMVAFRAWEWNWRHKICGTHHEDRRLLFVVSRERGLLAVTSFSSISNSVIEVAASFA